MKMKFSVVKYVPILVITMLLLASCGGGSSNPNNVTGNWTGTLTNTASQTAFVFTISLNQAADNSVSGTSLKFTTGAPCFENVSTVTGQFTLNGTFQGATTNTLQLKIMGSEPGELTFNTLDIQGAISGSTISGAWAMEGPAAGCSGSGSFTMTKS